MTRKPRIPGKQSGVGDRENQIAPVEKEKQKRSLGRHMRTFSVTKRRQRMNAYDDDDYIGFLLSTVESGDCAYFGAACSEAYTRGQKTGNMKDEEAAQVTALVSTCDYMLEVLLELSAQWPLKNLLAYFPRRDAVTVLGTGGAGEVTMVNYEDATMTDIFQIMRDLEIPDVVWKVVKHWNFIFKIADSYVDVKNNTIPARYIVPRIPVKSSADIKALVQLVWAEQGELRIHCQKFGIKTSKFSEEWLVPRIISINDIDALPYFAHACVVGRDSTALVDIQYYPTKPLHANDSEDKRWWFKNDPNESAINFLCKMLYPYNATYNKYGGALSGVLIPTGADSYILTAKFTEGTELEVKDYIEVVEILSLFLAAWEQTNTMNFELTGTAISNFDINAANASISWFRSGLDKELYTGTGIDEVSSDETYLSYLIELMF